MVKRSYDCNVDMIVGFLGQARDKRKGKLKNNFLSLHLQKSVMLNSTGTQRFLNQNFSFVGLKTLRTLDKVAVFKLFYIRGNSVNHNWVGVYLIYRP